MPYSDRAAGIISVLADKPVAYHPKLASVIGVKEAIFVCQLLYWHEKGKLPGGWIYKKQEEWTEETGLSRQEQETVRKHLTSWGLIDEKLAGIPAIVHFKLNFDRLGDMVDKVYPPANKIAEIPQDESSMQKPRNTVHRKPADKIAETTQSIPENTQEITLENTFCANAPFSFMYWIQKIRDNSKNQQAVIVDMTKTLYPDREPPDYGYAMRVINKVGAERLAELLWQHSTRPPVGDILAYVQGIAKNGNGGGNGATRGRERIVLQGGHIPRAATAEEFYSTPTVGELEDRARLSSLQGNRLAET